MVVSMLTSEDGYRVFVIMLNQIFFHILLINVVNV